jgi:signal transduction histidine kinase
MSAPFSDVTLAILLHGLILALLSFLILYFSLRRNHFVSKKQLTRAKSQMEQRLILETISAGSHEGDTGALIQSLGKHASEMTGFTRWAIWLKQNGGGFEPVASHPDGSGSGWVPAEDIAPEFYDWVMRNPSSVRLGSFVTDFAGSDRVRNLMSEFSRGLMIPFVDGADTLGFILLGGAESFAEKRSMQFLDLFGAIAAVLIKRSRLDRQEREMRRQEQRSRYLANLGQLAAGLAHEIRNPLAFMKSAMQHLTAAYEYLDEDRELADCLISQTNRIDQLIEELLTLGRINSADFEKTDLQEIVFGVSKFVESKARESGIRLTTEFTPGETRISGNGKLLWRLVLNLVTNGMEAMPDGGELMITGGREGGHVVVRIMDTGGGIAPEIADRVFDPFFTTKESGTGLGLATCFSVVAAHGGTIEIERSSPAGTCVKFSLPLLESVQTARDAK